MLDEGIRRYKPRLWDADYYLLTTLRKQLDECLQRTSGSVDLFDYGCGTRPYKSMVEAHGLVYSGGDIAGNDAADIVVEPYGHVPVPDETFDVVMSIQVLEHVEDVAGYLRESYRIAKRGAYLIVSTDGSWSYHPYPTDYWRWTRAGLEKVLRDNGFETVTSIGILGVLAYSTMVRLQCMKALCERVKVLKYAILPIVSVASQYVMRFEDWLLPSSVAKDNSAVYMVLARKR